MTLPNLKNILKFVQYGDRVHPTRDWFFVVSAIAIFIIGSMVWNGLLFLRVVNGEYIGVTATSTPAVSSNSIETVRSVFQKREAEENRYASEYRFVDPSR